jgi:ubiquinone/menaquinone biosynthesis C-methylase UbiE
VLEWPANTRSRDITTGLPHDNATVDVIYASHVFEHLTPSDLRRVLTECHRVLKFGALLRVVIPDLRKGTERFLAGDRAWFALSPGEPIADGYVRWLAMRTGEKGGRAERLLRRALRSDEGGHRWMYDGESMAQRLREVGFRDVQIRPFGESSSPAAAALDSRPHDSVHLDALR